MSCRANIYEVDHVEYFNFDNYSVGKSCTQKKKDFAAVTNICDTDNCALFPHRLQTVFV